jgi:hypothetical protein
MLCEGVLREQEGRQEEARRQGLLSCDHATTSALITGFSVVAFEKGQSGNPGGRPKESARIKALAQSHSESAIKKLVKLMDSDNESISLAASNALLDRGIGKPAQAIIGGDEDDPALSVVVRKITLGSL